MRPPTILCAFLMSQSLCHLFYSAPKSTKKQVVSFRYPLAFCVLLRYVIDGPIGRQAGLQFLGLFVILQDECIEHTLAADLELDLGGFLVSLYPRRGRIFTLADLEEVLNI